MTRLLVVFLILFGITLPAVAATPPEPGIYDDRNNDGVFNGGDVDLAGWPVTLPMKTTESIVVNKLAKSGAYIVVRIEAGKKITVRGNMSVTGAHGEIRFTASELRIENGVSLAVRSYLAAEIKGPVSIGDNVKLQASGSSPSAGFGNVSLRGHRIQTGAKFAVTSWDTFAAEATEADVSLGVGASLRTTGNAVALKAKSFILAAGAREIRGTQGVVFWVDDKKGKVDVTGSKLIAHRDSQVSFYYGDVALTPSLIAARYCLYYTVSNPDTVVCVEQPGAKK